MGIHITNFSYTACAVKATQEETVHDRIIKDTQKAQRKGCSGNEKPYFTYSSFLACQTALLNNILISFLKYIYSYYIRALTKRASPQIEPQFFHGKYIFLYPEQTNGCLSQVTSAGEEELRSSTLALKSK